MIGNKVKIERYRIKVETNILTRIIQNISKLHSERFEKLNFYYRTTGFDQETQLVSKKEIIQIIQNEAERIETKETLLNNLEKDSDEEGLENLEKGLNELEKLEF